MSPSGESAPSKKTADIEAKVAATRHQLESTLDSIEDKLNVPKRVGQAAKQAQASYESNPVPWIVGAVSGVAALAGVIVWVIRRR